MPQHRQGKANTNQPPEAPPESTPDVTSADVVDGSPVEAEAEPQPAGGTARKGKAKSKGDATNTKPAPLTKPHEHLPNVPIGETVIARFSVKDITSQQTETQMAQWRLDEAIRVAAQIIVNHARPDMREATFHQLRLAQLIGRDAIGRSHQ